MSVNNIFCVSVRQGSEPGLPLMIKMVWFISFIYFRADFKYFAIIENKWSLSIYQCLNATEMNKCILFWECMAPCSGRISRIIRHFAIGTYRFWFSWWSSCRQHTWYTIIYTLLILILYTRMPSWIKSCQVWILLYPKLRTLRCT